jgi:sulfur-oxidizing protein SoxZ
MGVVDMAGLNADNMKMRAQLKGDVTEALNGKTVLEAQWGTGISKNPYLTFRLKGAKVGDIVSVTWHDNLGETASHDIAVTQA